jgi:catechol-2,3-dioxygenase
MRGVQASLRAPDSDSHHDLAITGVGDRYAELGAGAGANLSHFALEVDTIDDLAKVRAALIALDRLDGEFDTGATLSIFGLDPDGNRFEVMWPVPPNEWGDAIHRGLARPLDLETEIARRR